MLKRTARSFLLKVIAGVANRSTLKACLPILVEDKDVPQHLRYLEQAIDFECDQDRGVLSRKEILVYSPMKTGTVTLYHSVKRHLMSASHRQDLGVYLLHNHNNESLASVLRLPDGVQRADILQRSVIADLITYKKLTDGHICLISSYRDPLSRAISEVFQIIEDLILKRCHLSRSDVSFDFCYERFRYHLTVILKQGHPVEEIEHDFFERQSFDHETKSCYVDCGHYEILMLCLEHVAHWERALEEHLGYRGIEVRVENTVGEKSIAGLSQEFKEWLQLDENFIKQIYFGDHDQQRQLRWFYTDDEINALYQNALNRYGTRPTHRTIEI